jgi:hypothetical protein
MAQFSGNLSADNRYSITLEVIETSYNTTNNTSDISYTLTATKSSGTGAYTGFKENQVTVVINGSTVFSQKLAYDFRGSTPKTITLASGTVKGIAHNADGRKNISVSASFTDTSNGKGSATASGTVTLTTIQRYLSITSLEITNKTENSIVVRWAVSNPRNSTYYSFDNGATWIGSATYGETLASDSKSGSFNIQGLAANTSYNLKVKFKRADNDLWTESNVVNFATLNYPHCISSPDFTIGDALTLDFYNPLGRNIRVAGYSKTDGREIFTGNTNGTRLVGFNDGDSVNKQYASIPNFQSSAYTVVVVYNDTPMTRDAGNVYRIRGNETPTINEMSYFDNNKNITDVTYNASEIVQNLSDLHVFFNGATPNYGAGGIVKYIVSCNGNSQEFGASGTYKIGTIDSANDVELTLTAIDSRGLSATKKLNVNMLAHSNPSAIVTLQRLNNYEDETYLTVDGSISSVNGKNTMKIEYRYKVSGGSYPANFEQLEDNVKKTFKTGLDKNQSYIFQIVVTDAFGAKYDKEHVLGKGVFPLFIDTVKNSVGVNCFPKGERTLEVNGVNVLAASMPYNDSTTADANSVTTQGVYVVPETAVNNYPEWNGNGILIVFSTSAGIFYQMFIKYEGSVWGRICWFGNWSGWAKLSN